MPGAWLTGSSLQSNARLSHYNPLPLSAFPIRTEVASEALKGRVFEVSLADLNSAEDLDYRKIKLVGEEVRGKELLTNFYGMDITRDKLNGLIRKWQTLIEAYADVKTTDGYTLRLFALAFTKRRPNQIRKTSYAQSSQIRSIRKKMVEIMTAGAWPAAAAWEGVGGTASFSEYGQRALAASYFICTRWRCRAHFNGVHVCVCQSYRVRPRCHPPLLSPSAEASKSDLKGLVNKFIPEAISKEIEKACNGIYPLQNVYIRKVKTIKTPRFDITKLMEMHGDSGEDTGKKVAEAPLVESLEGAGGRL